MQDERSQAPAVGGAASADLRTGSQRSPGPTGPGPLPWAILHRHGSPLELFPPRPPAGAVPSNADLPAGPAAVVVRPDTAAVVLGSAQPDDVVDASRATAASVPVVRRRSGGGAAWLDPDAMAWVDVVVPRGHPRWHDDVGRACWWVGDAWSAALASVGVGEAEVHRGAMVHTAWSRLVCFAGLGPGEVTVGGRKVVGIAQRRTRDVAVFQCGALVRWDPAPLLDVLALDEGARAAGEAQLRDVCAGVDDLAPDRFDDGTSALAAAFVGVLAG